MGWVWRPWFFVLLLAGPILWMGAETMPLDLTDRKAFSRVWDVSTWSTPGEGPNREGARSHDPANVTFRDGLLDLKLSASKPGQAPVCAEITSRQEYLYGSFRARLRTSPVPGAVVGFFLYSAGSGVSGDLLLNEIDIEILTRAPREVHFTLHHVTYSVDSAVVTAPFDPTAGFHEYRFDWTPGRVDFYLDGVLSASLTKNVPDRPMKLMLNHWSGNIPTWGGAAPDRDAHLKVASVEYRRLDIPAAGRQ